MKERLSNMITIVLIAIFWLTGVGAGYRLHSLVNAMDFESQQLQKEKLRLEIELLERKSR